MKKKNWIYSIPSIISIKIIEGMIIFQWESLICQNIRAPSCFFNRRFYSWHWLTYYTDEESNYTEEGKGKKLNFFKKSAWLSFKTKEIRNEDERIPRRNVFPVGTFNVNSSRKSRQSWKLNCVNHDIGLYNKGEFVPLFRGTRVFGYNGVDRGILCQTSC